MNFCSKKSYFGIIYVKVFVSIVRLSFAHAIIHTLFHLTVRPSAPPLPFPTEAHYFPIALFLENFISPLPLSLIPSCTLYHEIGIAHHELINANHSSDTLRSQKSYSNNALLMRASCSSLTVLKFSEQRRGSGTYTTPQILHYPYMSNWS